MRVILGALVGMHCLIVAFPRHTHLLFGTCHGYMYIWYLSGLYWVPGLVCSVWSLRFLDILTYFLDISMVVLGACFGIHCIIVTRI